MKVRHFHRIIIKYYSKMTSPAKISLTPIGVRGMKVLDRTKFVRNIQVPVLNVNKENLSKIATLCRSYFLKMNNLIPVQDLVGDNDKPVGKCIYLNPEKIDNWTDISDEDRAALQKYEVNANNFDFKEVQLCYDNWKFDTIFKAVLPENEDIVSSFSQIGHIVHLNLREHLLDYRTLIGQVLLDKIKTCKTVVNKSNIIDNTYRNFSMEVIAGEPNFCVTVKENLCKFQFDFSKVYWNPRLAKEHERILALLKCGDVLFDVFCGVGPFAIPAAKRKCIVYANDLNPDSFKWLNHNATTNKIKTSLFKSYNLDGKDFICNIFKDYITQYCKGAIEIEADAKIHVTMNLPALAVEFVKYFKCLIDDEKLIDNLKCDVIVYVYFFAVGDDPINVSKQMISANMQQDMSPYILDVFNVRNVAPNKEMMRVTLKLTKDILFGNKSNDDNNSSSNSEPPKKKLCVASDKNK